MKNLRQEVDKNRLEKYRLLSENRSFKSQSPTASPLHSVGSDRSLERPKSTISIPDSEQSK